MRILNRILKISVSSLLLYGVTTLLSPYSAMLHAQTIPAESDTLATEPSIAQEEEPAEDESLVRQTLEQDIFTLDFYQLQAWLERENLSTRGDINELRRRLFARYEIDVQAVSSEQSGEQNNLQVFIESATEGRYFDIEEVDEQYIALRGGVRIRLVDNVEGITHIIESNELIFNQEQNLVTARGDVNYLIERPSSTESFSGKTLIFQIDDWEGFFVDGGGVNPGSSAEQVDYRYDAELISRSADGVVVMENVAITSSPSADPYYHLQASKIWILGGSEWALEDATLYVGEIPLFYFPYFFRPGDEIVFHPVFGAQTRNGAFIQTTTYLRGRKPRAEDRFSFLQTENTEGKRQKLDGIFLRTGNELLSSTLLNSSDTIKLIIDYYTTLGAYVALEGTFADLGVVNPLNFNIALSYSRHLYRGTSFLNQYSSLFSEGDSAREFPVYSNLFGVSIPLRYIVDAQFSIAVKEFQSSVIFQLYSDRYVTQDFSQRSEDNDFYGLITGEQQFIRDNTSNTTDSFVWRVGGSYNAGAVASPYITQLSIQDAVFLVNWNSKLVGVDQPDYIIAADNSPQRYFFFPQTIVAPSVSFAINGTLLNPAIVAGIEQPNEEVVATSISEDARAPWDLPSDSEDDSDDADSDESEQSNDDPIAFRDPSALSNVGGYTTPVPVDYSLTYSFQPGLNVQFNTNNREWQRPEDVDFSVQYSTLTSDNQLQLNYMLNIYQQYLLLSGGFDLRGRYRTLLDTSNLTDSENTTLRNNAFAYSYFGVVNSNTLSSRFLQAYDSLSASNLSYSLTTQLYQYRYLETSGSGTPIYESVLPDFNPETITRHSLRLQLAWNVLAAQQNFTVTYRAPPLDQQATVALSTKFGPLQVGANFSAREDEGIWTLNPLSNTATIDIYDNISLSGNASLNLEEAYIQTLNVVLKTWFVTTTLSNEYLRDIDFISDFIGTGLSNPWQSVGDFALRPSHLNINLSKTFNFKPAWKNRVRASLTLNSALQLELQRYTNSFFTFGLGITLFIFEFLDLTFSANVRNDQIYLYVDDLARRVGRTPRNFFLDLLRSINIFDPDDLREGLFKLENISVQATHHLVDWDLILSYTASPLLLTESGRSRYVWDQAISISIAWRAISELRRQITVDRDDIISVE